MRTISSFDETIHGLERVVGKFLVRLRINVDRHNLDQVWPLMDLFEEAGWLGPNTNFFPYLARISPFTEACSSVSQDICTVSELQELNQRLLRRLHGLGVPVSLQGLYQFPEPKTYNCGAIGNNGFIFNPNGEIHKCGLAVDDSQEAVGFLGEDSSERNPTLEKWNEWSPFTNPTCRECEFLPSCLGGCPRNQMLMREVQKKENCEYYQRHENQMLASHLQLAQE